MSFALLGVNSQLQQTVTALGYEAPTPIQRQAIPGILTGHDLIAIAQTGTGKTAAFALPMIQNLLALTPLSERLPRALILTPTRELALQVHTDVLAYAQGTGLSAVLLHGGVSYVPQTRKLHAGVDIVVATPGRLRDHLEQGNLELGALAMLILDEADRMLDLGFSRDVDAIIAKTPRERQTMLFSATFPEEIRNLTQRFLVDPVSIHATPGKVTAQNVTHTLHPVDPRRKLDALFEVVHQHLDEQILIFARTKDRVDEVAKDLISRGVNCMAMHGDRTQAHRTKALARFKEGKVQVLVATDVAARGIDTASLGVVVNFELPHQPEDYVHRIGRTGRAGKAGVAISLVTQGELYLLGPIEHMVKFKLPEVMLEGFATAKLDRSKVRARAGKGNFARTGKPGASPLKSWARIR
jgi:ATP-dependent RNA helicase RhlE